RREAYAALSGDLTPEQRLKLDALPDSRGETRQTDCTDFGLVRNQPIEAVHNNELDLTLLCFEIQTELLPKGGEDRIREAIDCCRDVRSLVAGAAAIWSVAQREIVLAGESCSVDNFARGQLGQHSRQFRHVRTGECKAIAALPQAWFAALVR